MHLQDLEEMNTETVSRQANTLACGSASPDCSFTLTKTVQTGTQKEAFIPHMAVLL